MNDFASGVVGGVIRPTTSAASNRLAAAASKQSNSSNNAPPAALAFKVCHVPNLPNPDYGKELLERVVREFQPIVQRRNYNVISISELCCCCDGLDFAPGAAKRKRRKMSNNVWGYNQTSSFRGGKSHTIHLRMRHPADHARFLPYEDVAGTLSHELAHCEHGPHNDKFYKLMEEILEEHAQLMASGMSYGGAPLQAFGGAGRTLGAAGAGPTTTAPWGAAAATNNNNAAAAGGAFAGKGQTLGGGAGAGGRGYTLGGDKVFATWMTPAEAAVAAAQARQRVQQLRLRGDHCCRPCTIDISDDEEEENEETNETNGETSTKDSKQPPADAAAAKNTATDGIKKRRTNKENQKPAPAKKSNAPNSKVVVCIDLTSDDGVDDNDNGELDTKPAAKMDTKPPQQQASAKVLAPWPCRQCTFHNRPLALACEMCATERNSHLRTNP